MTLFAFAKCRHDAGRAVWFWFLLLMCCCVQAQFDPDAGLVRPYSHGAKLVSSSAEANVRLAFDGLPGTQWQSDAALPYGYLSSKTQNLLAGKVLGSGALAAATDGDTDTPVVLAAGQSYSLLLNGDSLRHVSFKTGAQLQLSLRLKSSEGTWTQLGSNEGVAAYQVHTLTLPQSLAAHELEVQVGNLGGQLFELGALGTLVSEYAGYVRDDLHRVGQVWLRSDPLQGAVAQTCLEYTTDGEHWRELRRLDVGSTVFYPIVLDEVIELRGMRIAHRYAPSRAPQGGNWQKVSVWELATYDEYGPYGRPPRGAPQGSPSIAQLLGVNGLWGWGYNQYSDLLPDSIGPERYGAVFAQARNYHNIDWDISAPGDHPEYEAMALGGGTKAMDWLDWDREYAAWRKAGLRPNLTVRLANFDAAAWSDPYAQAKLWAKDFGEHFAPGTLGTVEIGNEPWSYSPELYRKLLTGALDGLRAGNFNAREGGVLPCALQATDPAMEQTDVLRNYIGARLTAEHVEQLAGLNSHAYSYVRASDGVRRAVAPEHPASSFRETINMVRWRDHNAPGLPIYLTEFGYDSPGGPGSANCQHTECVPALAASAYTLRSILMASRLGLARTDYFFYADTEGAGLFTRSGLTTRIAEGAQAKPVWQGIERLTATLGKYRVGEVLHEGTDYYLYRLEAVEAQESGEQPLLVGWVPGPVDEQGQGATKELPRVLEGAVLVDDMARSAGLSDDRPVLTVWPRIYRSR